MFCTSWRQIAAKLPYLNLTWRLSNTGGQYLKVFHISKIGDDTRGTSAYGGPKIKG